MTPTDNTILVIGSLHHDIMLDAEHLPQLGETVTGSRWHTKFGGKGGNQAVAAASAGAQVRMVSAVGCDAFAKPILRALDEAGVDRGWVAEVAGVSSGMSVAISNSEGDYGAVIVSGANLEINGDLLNEDNVWEQVGLLCLQNEIDEAINITAARVARSRSIPTCLNAAPARTLPDTLLRSIDILVVNEIELAMLSEETVDTMEQIVAAARKLAYRVPTVLVTLGDRGVVVQESNQQARHVMALDITVNSTHGAGDAFIGELCASLIHGADMTSAVTRANKAAGLHVAGHSAQEPEC